MNRLLHRVICWELFTFIYHLLEHIIQRFDGVRRIGRFMDVRRVAEDFPVRAPDFSDLQVFFTPDSVKLAQHH